ncbi:MAG TPA: class I SAM-dependent methyltransferase [Actinomycetota bacterium]|nr:class I SAM-dependent methyltransferase [Actinomycetota bacterium]
MASERSAGARALFAGIAPAYDRPAAVLSFGEYGRWRRALVRALPLADGDAVLDVACGTGLISRDLEQIAGARVTGLDQSLPMLTRGAGARVAGQAERLPFAGATFDGVVFSYLLRYVDDPAATIAEMARVLRPGGVMGSVEFGVPRARLPRLGWRIYSRGVFPWAARIVSPGWGWTGQFLPGSIMELDASLPPEKQAVLWQDAGLTDVRIKRMTFGTGVLMMGRKDGRAAP